jgi:hypothetical protein
MRTLHPRQKTFYLSQEQKISGLISMLLKYNEKRDNSKYGVSTSISPCLSRKHSHLLLTSTDASFSPKNYPISFKIVAAVH